VRDFPIHGFWPWRKYMEGNKFGKIMLVAIMLIAAGAVVSADLAHYAAEKDAAVDEAYSRGMTEMHNAMSGTELSEQEVLRLHEKVGCTNARSL
jgi:hypothetical protein